MSGKAYTMQEMKSIVEYLVEHKAYGEIRGRKMWMEFANSSATSRTWQSLKETFLKRILQDIQNPYYNLTRDQVCSFKQGCDVEAKEKKNRLEVRTASESSHNSETLKKTEQAPTKSTENGNEVEKTPGEKIKSAKIPARNRSSADTLILDESNPQENQDNPKSPEPVLEPTTKSSKECLEFEYPLTPAVKEVIDAFETESESSERMQIVENSENAGSNINKVSELIIIEDSENIDDIDKNALQAEKIIIDDGLELEVGPILEEVVSEDHTVQDIDNWLKSCMHNDQENPDENITEDVATNAVEGNKKGGANENVDNVTKNKVNNESSLEPGKSVATVKENNAVKESSVTSKEGKSNDAVKENNVNDSNSKATETIEPMNVDENIEVTSTGKDRKLTNSVAKTKDSLSTTADTIIPNNQEVIIVDSTTNKVNTQDTLLTQEKDTIFARKRSSSHDKNVNKKMKVDNGVVEKPEIADNERQDVVEINTASSNDSEACDAPSKEKVDSNKPSTSKAADMRVVPLEKNPCLQSVSLFEEQFNNTKYSDSEEETPIPRNNTNKVTIVNRAKDVIDLKSDSDNEVEESSVQPNKPTQRYKHLAKAFGFTPGTSAAVPRRRSLRCRNRRSKSQRNSITLRSESSQWETGSASEPYVSPPRGRRNRYARRYMRPPSDRILSLDGEGGLFVACRNKIYPLVKDGKILKSFVTYNAGSGSEEEENSFWRQKYVEEKKKTAELQKQLDQAKAQAESATRQPVSSILPNPTRASSDNRARQNASNSEINKMNIEQIGDTGKIHITLSKGTEESINLEGQWPHVLPIVNQVMNIFYKTDGVACNADISNPSPKKNISGLVTPIIPVVADLEAREKVKELESAIFKEIEERDKADNIKDNDANVTSRKVGRPKKSPSSSNPSEPNIKQRRSKRSITDKVEPAEAIKEIPEILVTSDSTSEKTKKAEQVPKKSETKEIKPKSPRDISKGRVEKAIIANEKSDGNNEIESPAATVNDHATRTQGRRSRKSGNETDSSSRTTRQSSKSKEELEEVRYMFPPEPKTRSAKKARSSEEPHATSQGRSGNSIDSTQGYQDSDDSPMRVERMNITKRKRKVSLTVRKGKPVTRRRSFSTFQDMSLDSNNSCYFVPLKTTQSVLDSAIYKTESYQILMHNGKHSLKVLKSIDEISPVNNEDKHSDVVSKESSECNLMIEVGSSSNVSLPLSPELSVVENLSISREMIRGENHPTINETQANDENIYDQHLIPEVDVSIPLMQQQCLVNNENKKTTRIKAKAKPGPNSLGNKDCTVNMSYNNNNLSQSLDSKLRDLMLESAKKITGKHDSNLMDVDESIEPPKKKGKKRCSTPQKRNPTKKQLALEPPIAEHMETCSHSGRNSCPPVITFIPFDENANNCADVKLIGKPKPRVKKDIIKVKILRPKNTQIKRSRSRDAEERGHSKASCTNRLSVCTDSGINETVSISGEFFQGDSVELIHNHSETCLQANECIGDSVEFVENSKSVISLNSSESHNELMKIIENMDKSSGEYHTVNAVIGSENVSSEVFVTPTDTVYHSPVASNTSLITEDLSEETPPPNKWYLFSDDDTNNTPPENITSNGRVSNFTANLNKLFPIACAVPDLSTISEMSRENDSRKTGLDTDGDTRSTNFCQSPV